MFFSLNFGVYEMFSKSFDEHRGITSVAVVLVASAMMLFSAESKAQGYIGGSVGQAGIEIVDGSFVPPLAFDEDDFAWKAFAGYNFGLSVINLGIEGGYVNFGSPSTDILGSKVKVEATGFDLFGVLGFNLGPVGIFAKAGVIAWDGKITADGLEVGSDDGSDPAYGVGAKIGLGSLDIRAEYESFDIGDAEDVNMFSLGLVWNF
jgi:outer membrane immunogenic protein